MPLDPTTNFAKGTLTTGYDASAVTVVLQSGNGALFPQPSTDGAFNLVWFNFTDYSDPTDDPNKEIVRCTARSSDTLTITRAQESTSAVTHNTSGKTYKMILAVTKKMITNIGAAGVWYDVSGLINSINLTYTIPVTPTGQIMLFLARQPQMSPDDFSISGATITYSTPPDASLSGQPHKAFVIL